MKRRCWASRLGTTEGAGASARSSRWAAEDVTGSSQPGSRGRVTAGIGEDISARRRECATSAPLRAAHRRGRASFHTRPREPGMRIARATGQGMPDEGHSAFSAAEAANVAGATLWTPRSRPSASRFAPTAGLPRRATRLPASVRAQRGRRHAAWQRNGPRIVRTDIDAGDGVAQVRGPGVACGHPRGRYLVRHAAATKPEKGSAPPSPAVRRANALRRRRLGLAQTALQRWTRTGYLPRDAWPRCTESLAQLVTERRWLRVIAPPCAGTCAKP